MTSIFNFLAPIIMVLGAIWVVLCLLEMAFGNVFQILMWRKAHKEHGKPGPVEIDGATFHSTLKRKEGPYQ